MASPDFAKVKFDGSWWLRLGGALLGVVAATVGAIRLVGSSAPGDDLEITPSSTVFRYTRTIAICLLAAAIDWFVRILWSNLRSPFAMDVKETIGSMFVDPNMYFVVAIAVLSAQLLRRCWRLPVTDWPIKIAALPSGRFAATWTALTATLVIGVPTLAAATFSWWLGPWYRW